MSKTAEVFADLAGRFELLPLRISETTKVIVDPATRAEARKQIAALRAAMGAALNTTTRAELGRYWPAVRPFRQAIDVVDFYGMLAEPHDPSIDLHQFFFSKAGEIRDTMTDLANDLRNAGRDLALLPPMSAGSATAKPKRKRRRAKMETGPRPLTAIESQTLTVVAGHHGNKSAAAKELGKDLKTVKENWDRANAKLLPILGSKSRSVNASRLPINKRDQQDSEDRRGR